MRKLAIGTNVKYIGENETLKNKIGHIDGYDDDKYRVSFEEKEINGIGYTCYCVDAKKIKVLYSSYDGMEDYKNL